MANLLDTLFDKLFSDPQIRPHLLMYIESLAVNARARISDAEMARYRQSLASRSAWVEVWRQDDAAMNRGYPVIARWNERAMVTVSNATIDPPLTLASCDLLLTVKYCADEQTALVKGELEFERAGYDAFTDYHPTAWSSALHAPVALPFFSAAISHLDSYADAITWGQRQWSAALDWFERTTQPMPMDKS